MDEHPQTLDELVKRIARARADLDALVEGLDEEQLTQALVPGQWSVADHLAHLAAWERGVAEYLRGRSRAEGMGLTEAAWGMSMDEMNALIYRRHETSGASQTRLLLRKAQEEMSEALNQLTDDDLQRDYGEFLPEGQESPYGERTVLHTIGANTYAHYEEHAATIRRVLEQNR